MITKDLDCGLSSTLSPIHRINRIAFHLYSSGNQYSLSHHTFLSAFKSLRLYCSTIRCITSPHSIVSLLQDEIALGIRLRTGLCTSKNPSAFTALLGFPWNVQFATLLGFPWEVQFAIMDGTSSMKVKVDVVENSGRIPLLGLLMST